MKKSLFSAVKEFVNSVGAGNEFTSTQFINEVGEFENSTGWKRGNGVHSYRAHQYKGYLRRAGILENIKRGTWKVLYNIPEEVTLTDINYAIGYTTTHKWNPDTRTSKVSAVKKNPFNFAAYFAKCDAAGTMTNPIADEIPMPHSGEGVVEVDTPKRTVYIVNLESGGIAEREYELHDHSFKTIPYAFLDLDSAEAFAEGIVPVQKVEDEELDEALSELENDLAETLVREGSPESDIKPEELVSMNITEEEFEEAKAKMVQLEIPEVDVELQERSVSGGSYVAILIPPGTEIYQIERDSDKMVTVLKDIVYEVEIEITEEGVEYEFETKTGSEFTKDDLGVTVFLDKAEATKAIMETI